jgi:hypothetical protein
MAIRKVSAGVLECWSEIRHDLAARWITVWRFSSFKFEFVSDLVAVRQDFRISDFAP